MKKPGPQNAKNQGFKWKNGNFSHSNPWELSGNTRVSTLRNPKFPRSSMGCPGAFPAGNSLGMRAWPLWEFGNGSHGAFLSWEFLGNAPSGLQEWPPWVLPETENSSGMREQPLREWFLGNTGMAPQDHS